MAMRFQFETSESSTGLYRFLDILVGRQIDLNLHNLQRRSRTSTILLGTSERVYKFGSTVTCGQSVDDTVCEYHSREKSHLSLDDLCPLLDSDAYRFPERLQVHFTSCEETPGSGIP